MTIVETDTWLVKMGRTSREFYVAANDANEAVHRVNKWLAIHGAKKKDDTDMLDDERIVSLTKVLAASLIEV
jgi:hypothetical protein